jgi:hypothetical protein
MAFVVVPACLTLGGGTYAASVPERWWPGAFDIVVSEVNQSAQFQMDADCSAEVI